jgi:hypothetical protein
VAPEDRDLLTRTILGEAGDQDDLGKAAVGHVVLNRLRDGSFGRTPSDVMLAKNAFEPWNTRPRELLAIDRNSAPYQRTAAIVDGILAGKVADPTYGATHFLDEGVVRHRIRTGERSGWPKWASGDTLKIGDHSFFYPQTGGKAAARDYKPSDADKSLLEEFGAQPATAPGVEAAPTEADRLLLKEFEGHDEATAEAAAGRVSTPIAPDELPDSPQWLRRAVHAAGDVPYGPTVGQHFTSSMELGRSGLEDLLSGRVLPSFNGSANPLEWSGGGVLKTLGGGLGAVYSPVSAGIEKFVEAPTEAATGSPLLGKIAGFGASLAIPGPKFFPKTRASHLITHDTLGVGAHDIMASAPILRASEHPHLSLMDVNPRAAQLAADIVQNPNTPAAASHLINVARRRGGMSEEIPASVAAKFAESDSNQLASIVRDHELVGLQNKHLLAARGAVPIVVRPPGHIGEGAARLAAPAFMGEMADLITHGALGHTAAYAGTAAAVAKRGWQAHRYHADQSTYLQIAKMLSEPGGESVMKAVREVSSKPGWMPNWLYGQVTAAPSLFDRIYQPAAYAGSVAARTPHALKIRQAGQQEWQ